MAFYVIPKRYQGRRGTYTELYSRNEVLFEGEHCWETHDEDDFPRAPWWLKVGDGETPWNDLTYAISGGGASGSSGQVPIILGDTETFFVASNRQVLFAQPIELEGDASLEVDGLLIEVS